MSYQQGSVLAGTIALSMVIAVGAAGLLLLAGAWNSSTSNEFDRQLLFNAAESGLQLGAQKVRQTMTKDDLPTIAGETNLSNNLVPIEGADVLVSLRTDADASHHLVSKAQLSDCKERVILEWTIDIVPGAGLPSTIMLQKWKESFQTCAP